MNQAKPLKLNRNFLDKLASFISYIFIAPGLTMLIFVYLGLELESDLYSKFSVIGFSSLFGFVIPVTYFIILRKKNRIVDDDASDKDQRTIPYLFGVLLSILSIICITIFGGSWISIVVWIAYLISLLAMIPINIYWKISAHTIGISIPLAVFLFVNDYQNLGALLLIVVVGWARMRLKMHNFLQVLSGSILGLTITTTLLLFLTERIF